MSEPSRDPLRLSLRSLTHGVYVLGVCDGHQDHYLVISLLMQCSVQPPRIAFAVGTQARIVAALRASQSGAISVLDSAQLPAVRRYGVPGGARQLPVSPLRLAPGNHPVVPEATRWLSFGALQEVAAGDHFLYIADAMEAGGVAEESPADQAFMPMTLASSGFPYAG